MIVACCIRSLGGSSRLVAMEFVHRILNVEDHQLAELWEIIERELATFFQASSAGFMRAHIGWPEIVRTAESWAQAGIYIITRDDLESFGRTCVNESCLMFAKGPANHLQHPTVSVLNSRKSKCVKPDDDWLLKTRVAVDEALKKKATLVSSIGIMHYDVVTAACKGSNLILVCESLTQIMNITNSQTRLFERYSGMLDMEKTLFISVSCLTQQSSGNESALLRDRFVGSLSDVIYSINVKPGGNMSRVLSEAGSRNVPLGQIDANLVGGLAVNKQGYIRPKEFCEPLSRKRLELKNFFSVVLGSWVITPSEDVEWLEFVDEALFHYTRSCHGPWPGQSYQEYITSLLAGRPESSHSAFETILRIALEQRIRASGAMIRGKFPVVSFTEVPPNELEKIRIWRTGVYRWTLEPYGLAIKRRTLAIKGGRRVHYGSLSAHQSLQDDEKHLFQISRTGKYDWSREKEWRIKGDLDIKELPADDWAFVLPTQDEADTMFNSMTIPFVC